jgi:hypothetical protein
LRESDYGGPEGERRETVRKIEDGGRRGKYKRECERERGVRDERGYS